VIAVRPHTGITNVTTDRLLVTIQLQFPLMALSIPLVLSFGESSTMSSGHTAGPGKETVYDGPEVDVFKRSAREDPKLSAKETVHDGDVPEFITRRFTAAQVGALAKPQTETVYHGAIPEMFLKLGRIAQDLVMPDRETIYSGPNLKVRQVVDVTHIEPKTTDSTKETALKETVYDENTFVRKQVDTSASRSLVTRLVQRASVRFFAVAILSLVELYLCRDNLSVAISSGIMALTFMIVAFYTFKLNLKALLLAIGIYFCSTLFMTANAILTENVLLMIVPLLSRAFMIYNLIRTYGLLVDLHLLEAEIY
jgi:hypothetical protein